VYNGAASPAFGLMSGRPFNYHYINFTEIVSTKDPWTPPRGHKTRRYVTYSVETVIKSNDLSTVLSPTYMSADLFQGYFSY